ILLRQKQKKLIMLPSETMIWQPEFTDKTLSRKIGAVQGTEIKPESDYVCTHLFSGLQASCYFLKCKIIKNKDTS
ncbi:hypothetical protein ACK6SB_23565, partial [Escherichia coli]